jgi:hypothetical protein
MNATPSFDQRVRRRRHVTGAATTVGGLLVLVIGAAVAWSWRGELPDPVASHWGADGQPDGFSSLNTALAVLLGVGGLSVLFLGGVTWALGKSAATLRMMAAATVWLSLFMAIVVVGSLSIQRGLSDAREVGSINGVLLVAILAPIVPAILAAVAVPGDPRQPTTAPVPADAPRVKLVDGERAVWINRVGGRLALYLAVPIALTGVALAVWFRIWPALVVDVVVIVVLLTFTTFVVRVDHTGLTVRSAVGWPRYRVPLDEVVRAGVTQVSPLKDFGGWGWRVGRDGRLGVVLRRGEALLVERTGGRAVVITVDEAAKAAGLLNALADRARTGR